MFLECEHWKKDYSLVSGLRKGQFNHNIAKLLLATSDAFEKWEIGGRIQMSATTEVPLIPKIPNSQMFIWGPDMSWRLSRGYTLPLLICKWSST